MNGIIGALSCLERPAFHGSDSIKCMYYRNSDWHVYFGYMQNEAESEIQNSYKNNFGSILFSGQVYNTLEIRRQLEIENCAIATNNDAEILLIALQQWGINKTLNLCNGKWAFAWYDIQNNRIVLARDRFGVKPLYYHFDGELLIFASDVKTILKNANKKFKIEFQTVGNYLLQSLLETDNSTFFQGVLKVPPAHYCNISLAGNSLSIQAERYWKVPSCIEESTQNESLLIEEVRSLFTDAVRIRMRSDESTGVLLSGGLDSSSIASAMKLILGADAKFSILSSVSENKKYDESAFIDIMANYIDLPVTKVSTDIIPSESLSLLEKACWISDGPVGSFSNVAHYLLMKRAKEHGIKVIFSGQAADELLCGYRKYLAFYIQQLVSHGKLYKAAKLILSFFRQGTIINQFSYAEAKRYLPNIMKRTQIDIRGEALKDYRRIDLGLSRDSDVISRQVADIEKYSIPILTHFEERMSTAWSREVRTPFLDYRLVEKLVPMSVDMKLRDGWTKYILRKAMEPNLPKEIVWRKDKQGFINPQADWFKTELKEQVQEIFNDDCYMYKLGIVNKENLLSLYEAYCEQPEGKGIYSYKDIFNPLSLEIWLKQFAAFIL